MTPQQEQRIDRAKYHLNQARYILDAVMYRMTPLSETEFKKVRKMYDKICESYDQI